MWPCTRRWNFWLWKHCLNTRKDTARNCARCVHWDGIRFGISKHFLLSETKLFKSKEGTFEFFCSGIDFSIKHVYVRIINNMANCILIVFNSALSVDYTESRWLAICLSLHFIDLPEKNGKSGGSSSLSWVPFTCETKHQWNISSCVD